MIVAVDSKGQKTLISWHGKYGTCHEWDTRWTSIGTHLDKTNQRADWVALELRLENKEITVVLAEKCDWDVGYIPGCRFVSMTMILGPWLFRCTLVLCLLKKGFHSTVQQSARFLMTVSKFRFAAY